MQNYHIRIFKGKKKPYVSIPPEWSYEISDGPGPFVTMATFKTPEGLFLWSSRHHRKHHYRLDRSLGSTWWAPKAIGWWIGILFAIGSIFFAIGTIPAYVKMLGATYDGLNFFIGSVFFTSAAFLQYIETINSPHSIGMKIREPVHIFSWEPSRIDWWSTLIQLVGTLFFNFSTFASIGIIFLFNKMVWTPDLFGSVCFLIASFLAWSEANHSLWSWNIKSLSWWISLFNLLGSVAFGISAIGAYISPTTNLTLDPFIMNLGTFIGAICFFIGALLLLPERTSDLLNLEGLNFEKYLKDGHNIFKL